MRQHIEFIAIVGLTLGLVACGGKGSLAAASTPDIDRTIEFAVQATVEASLPTNAPEPTQTPSSGAWVSDTSTNLIDDSKVTVVGLTAMEGEGIYGDPIALILRCKGTKLDVFIQWNSYLGTDTASVAIRLDDGAPTRNSWALSSDGQSTFLKRNSSTFIFQELIPANRLVAQVTPYSENPITAVFDLSGIDQIGPQIMDACSGG